MGLLRFLKTTIVGGILFVVPVLLLAMLGKKVLDTATHLAQPLADVLPLHRPLGIVIADLIVLLVLLALCFLAGLIAKSSLVGRMVTAAEGKFLWRIPGYAQFRAIMDSLNPDSDLSSAHAVLCHIGDRSQFGYEIERTPDGQVLVFMPGAPNPWSGTVIAFAAEHVQALDTPVIKVAGCLRRLGRGGGRLLVSKGSAGGVAAGSG
ncbi:MAG TPA: hypothetical protein VNM87_13270 [Candidatus Udaeobacter sp.]|nr:hypothetical protein [Candidatus Udaeobacter sp.]